MRHLVTALIVLLTGVAALAADDKPNAADLYKKAYEKLEALAPELNDAFWVNEGVITEPLPPEQVKLFEATADIARLMAEARNIKACDWKTVIKNPWDMSSIPNLAISRRAARLTLIRAAHYRSQGREKESIDELLTGWALGRRVGYGQMMIAALIQASIDGMMTHEFARIAPLLSKDGRDQIAASLAGLPVAPTLREAAKIEYGVMGAFLRGAFFDDIKGNVEILRATGEGEHKFDAALRVVQGEDAKEVPFDDAPYKSIQSIAEKDPVLFKRLVDEMEASMVQYCELYDLPAEDREAFRIKWRAGLDRSNPLYRLVLKQSRSVNNDLSDISRRIVSLNAMLRAGLAYLDEGDAALAMIIEPGSKQRFDVEKTAKGFVLRSRTVKLGDEFASLTFGPEVKKTCE